MPAPVLATHMAQRGSAAFCLMTWLVRHASCLHQTPTWQEHFHRGEAVLLNAGAQAPKAAPAPGKDAAPAGEHHGMRASAAGLGDLVALQAAHLGRAQLAAAGLVAEAQPAVFPPAPGIHLCRAARSSKGCHADQATHQNRLRRTCEATSLQQEEAEHIVLHRGQARRPPALTQVTCRDSS